MRKKSAGFTLIETLIVVFLIGIVLVAGGNIFFGIMKGSSKAEAEKEVKQNGAYALAVMERMIRNSRRVMVCDTDSLEIENLDYGLTTFHQLGENRIASSSAEGDLYLTAENVEVSSLTFSCIYDPPSSSYPEDLRRIGINFVLSPRGGTVEAPETFAEIEFQTSVSLRNF